ncbi:hypothetical protein DD238_004501 [Peronospora effusa]|uniref:Uncharacterized protein n=1 Tax=Peronospora effusa TaxID=542832 RepID=A0A3M6VP14_9STRA|nr:hypothetical protein DD238_004501 [Peronospora effusa]
MTSVYLQNLIGSAKSMGLYVVQYSVKAFEQLKKIKSLHKLLILFSSVHAKLGYGSRDDNLTGR